MAAIVGDTESGKPLGASPTVSDLVGKDLSSFKVVEMIEVYKTDYDGLKSASLGFFKDETLANAYAGLQTDAPWYKTKKSLVLTNGEIGFLVGVPVQLFNDEHEVVEVKNKIMAKLTPAERKIITTDHP